MKFIGKTNQVNELECLENIEKRKLIDPLF